MHYLVSRLPRRRTESEKRLSSHCRRDEASAAALAAAVRAADEEVAAVVGVEVGVQAAVGVDETVACAAE